MKLILFIFTIISCISCSSINTSLNSLPLERSLASDMFKFNGLIAIHENEIVQFINGVAADKVRELATEYGAREVNISNFEKEINYGGWKCTRTITKKQNRVLQEHLPSEKNFCIKPLFTKD